MYEVHKILITLITCVFINQPTERSIRWEKVMKYILGNVLLVSVKVQQTLNKIIVSKMILHCVSKKTSHH